MRTDYSHRDESATDTTVVTTADEVAAELTQLLKYRTNLWADRMRGVGRLRAVLAAIFPALAAGLNYSDKSALLLVAGLCTPAEIRDAGTAGVRNYLTDNGAAPDSIGGIASTLMVAAAEQHVAVPGEAMAATLAKQLAGTLLELDREIDYLGIQIATRFRALDLDEVGIGFGARTGPCDAVMADIRPPPRARGPAGATRSRS